MNNKNKYSKRLRHTINFSIHTLNHEKTFVLKSNVPVLYILEIIEKLNINYFQNSETLTEKQLIKILELGVNLNDIMKYNKLVDTEDWLHIIWSLEQYMELIIKMIMKYDPNIKINYLDDVQRIDICANGLF